MRLAWRRLCGSRVVEKSGLSVLSLVCTLMQCAYRWHALRIWSGVCTVQYKKNYSFRVCRSPPPRLEFTSCGRYRLSQSTMDPSTLVSKTRCPTHPVSDDIVMSRPLRTVMILSRIFSKQEKDKRTSFNLPLIFNCCNILISLAQDHLLVVCPTSSVNSPRLP